MVTFASLKSEWLTVSEQLDLFRLPGIEFPEVGQVFDSFETLYTSLMAYNNQVNLTRIVDPREFLYRHLVDSLLLLPLIPPGARVADVGSGAGFPALPLVLARPDIRMTAIEGIQKKCRFIQEAADSFALGERLIVLSERAEVLGHREDFREQFDVGMARAVSALPTLLEWVLPLVRPGGSFLALKGPKADEELSASGNALSVLKARLVSVRPYDLEALHGSRVLAFEKTGITPLVYPRDRGLPLRKPL